MAPLRPLFVGFGDSITQRGWSPGGWLARLSDLYGRRADVLNRGYSGYNTTFALALLPRLVEDLRGRGGAPPALAILFFGANDAALPGRGSGRQHVPLGEYEKALEAIARGLLAAAPDGGAGAGALVVAAPPPVDEQARVLAKPEFGGVPERTDAVAREYADAAGRVAARLAAERAPVAFLDTHAAFSARGPDGPTGWKALLSDGLHFGPAGEEAFYDALVDAVDKAFPSLSKTSLPYDVAEWFDIDAANPAASFQSKEAP